MRSESRQLLTRVVPETTLGKIVQFPLTRAVIAVLFFAPFLVVHNTVVTDLILSSAEPARSLLRYADAVASVAVLLAFYALYLKWVERRPAFEISIGKAATELGVGALTSCGIVAAMVFLMWLLAYYRVDSVAPAKTVADAFFLFGVGAFIQVLFFRLILFRLLEEWLGTWAAIVLVSAIFGLAHMGNENATLWSALALAVTDVYLIAPFVLTRRLWMAWGLHWSWNFTQDGLFGLPNSGLTELPSWISPTIDGPTWVTGGAFGIEASPVAIVITLGVGLLLLKLAMARAQIVAPSWRRVRC